jgi:hypothetical protein
MLSCAGRRQRRARFSKLKAAPYCSGASRDRRKIKLPGWREANQERWRLLERR